MEWGCAVATERFQRQRLFEEGAPRGDVDTSQERVREGLVPFRVGSRLVRAKFVTTYVKPLGR